MPYEYQYAHRVRYRECDPMGVVYHTHYLDYFEAGRTEALRNLGVSYRSLEDRGIIMPVTDVSVKYRRPAHYDDELLVTVRFDEMPSVRVPINYTVRRKDEDPVLATGHTTLCFMDADRRRPTSAPEVVHTVFADALSS
ncbi:MAG: thioesterase family protein [Salinibacter sp.]